MRIGLISDSHDRVPAVADLVTLMVERGVSLVMHAGDYCSPFSLQPFVQANLPLLGVYGRNDGDHEGLSAAGGQGMAIELFEAPHSFSVADRKFLLVHDLGDVTDRSIEQHEFVVHGFTHQAEMKTRGDTLLINPGEACGWLYGSCTAAVLDLHTKDVEILKL